MNKKIEVINSFDFDGIINKGKKPILLYFYAKWCTPCKMQEPIVCELYDILKDKVDFYKIDIDESENLAELLDIKSIPYLMVYYDKEIKEKSVGLTSLAQLSQMLIKYV